MEVSFPTDSDGYLSQECPSCEQIFKVVFGEGSEEPISFCPYCGHSGRDCWYTKPQVEYMLRRPNLSDRGCLQLGDRQLGEGW